jgi:hypothetical protein
MNSASIPSWVALSRPSIARASASDGFSRRIGKACESVFAKKQHAPDGWPPRWAAMTMETCVRNSSKFLTSTARSRPNHNIWCFGELSGGGGARFLPNKTNNSVCASACNFPLPRGEGGFVFRRFEWELSDSPEDGLQKRERPGGGGAILLKTTPPYVVEQAPMPTTHRNRLLTTAAAIRKVSSHA